MKIDDQRAILQELLDRFYAQLELERLFYTIMEKDDEHPDPRTNIYYMGAKKAIEYQMEKLKALSDEYALRYGPTEEPILKLVVNKK